MLRGGFFEPSSIFFTKFPVPDAPSEIKAKVEDLVKIILGIKALNPGADVCEIEREINGIVYELFGLGDEEIGVIEG